MPEGDRVVLSGQRLRATDFGGRRLSQFSSDGCRFEGCTFEGVSARSASFGAGQRTSEYIGCNFDGAKLKMGPGGYARFVDCSFEDVVIEGWFCFAVEIVGCTFSGRLKKAVFNGTVPADKQDIVQRRANQFEDNDFSRLELIDVGFRTGIDLSRQQLPGGDEYTILTDAVDAVRRARIAFDAWDDQVAKQLAGGVLVTMEADVAGGQKGLLLRVEDYPRSSRSAVRALLKAAQGR